MKRVHTNDLNKGHPRIMRCSDNVRHYPYYLDSERSKIFDIFFIRLRSFDRFEEYLTLSHEKYLESGNMDIPLPFKKFK